VPVSKDFHSLFKKRSRADLQQYTSMISDIALKHNATFMQIKKTDRFKDHEFADVDHMNLTGANHLSKMLAIKYAELQ